MTRYRVVKDGNDEYKIQQLLFDSWETVTGMSYSHSEEAIAQAQRLEANYEVFLRSQQYTVIYPKPEPEKVRK